MATACSSIPSTTDPTGPPAPLLIVAGPTASGKSAAAIDLAATFDGVLINADSMQAYRDLRVLTARPSAEDEARVPHRLYGFLDAADPCSAGRWKRLAEVEIAAAREAGKLPIAVGGTGLYLSTLTRGIADIPAIPQAVRDDAGALHERLGGAGFRDALSRFDPGGAARLSPTDRQRLLRAWEVVRATGRPLSAWQADATRPAAEQFAAVILLPPRAELYAAIDARVEQMVAGGAMAEVAALLGRNLAPELPAMKAVGVRELARHLRDGEALPAAIAAAQQASRNYAKRQFTWLRNQKVASHRLITQDYHRDREKIFSFIRQFLLTRPK